MEPIQILLEPFVSYLPVLYQRKTIFAHTDSMGFMTFFCNFYLLSDILFAFRTTKKPEPPKLICFGGSGPFLL